MRGGAVVPTSQPENDDDPTAEDTASTNTIKTEYATESMEPATSPGGEAAALRSGNDETNATDSEDAAANEVAALEPIAVCGRPAAAPFAKATTPGSRNEEVKESSSEDPVVGQAPRLKPANCVKEAASASCEEDGLLTPSVEEANEAFTAVGHMATIERAGAVLEPVTATIEHIAFLPSANEPVASIMSKCDDDATHEMTKNNVTLPEPGPAHPKSAHARPPYWNTFEVTHQEGKRTRIQRKSFGYGPNEDPPSNPAIKRRIITPSQQSKPVIKRTPRKPSIARSKRSSSQAQDTVQPLAVPRSQSPILTTGSPKVDSVHDTPSAALSPLDPAQATIAPQRVRSSRSLLLKLQVAPHTQNRSSTFPPSPPTTPQDPVLTAQREAKVALAQHMMHRLPIENKPAPLSTPLVWADDRQALCETLPNFQAYNGGAYTNDGHAYGFMIDGHSGPCREYIDEDLVISRMSGGMGQDEDVKGAMTQAKDQTMDHAVARSLLNNIAHRDPVIMIFGNRSSGVKTKMPKKYNVAGHYKPIGVWSEKTRGKTNAAHPDGTYVTVKYRLERMRAHVPAWFASPAGTAPFQAVSVPPMHIENCHCCGEEYPQVYLFGWCCLNSQCKDFWTLDDGSEAPCSADELYDPSYLLYRTPWEVEEPPQSVVPPLPVAGNIIGDHLGREHNRGIVCGGCGKCLPRWKWDHWVCNEPKCGWIHRPKRDAIQLSSIIPHWELLSTGPPTARKNHYRKGAVSMQTLHRPGEYKGHIYSFGAVGSVAYLMPYASVRAEHHGVDQMFKAMQEEEHNLERRLFHSPVAPKNEIAKIRKRKRVLADDMDGTEDELPAATEVEPADKPSKQGSFMNAFSMNYGEPYKFVASGASAPFDSAPWPVRQFRSVANYLSDEYLPSTPEEKLDFNELLIFAYTSGQKINYHDDGEAGLGPRIATLSLGGKARMNLRMKAKYYTGVDKNGLFIDEPPLQGCYEEAAHFEPRMQAWRELQQLKAAGNTKAYNDRRAQIPREIGLHPRPKNAAPALELGLAHGTIVIMDGYALQKYFEHEVDPEDTLRFALTCRHIKREHLMPHERPAYSVEPDTIRYSGPKVRVSGEEVPAGAQAQGVGVEVATRVVGTEIARHPQAQVEDAAQAVGGAEVPNIEWVRDGEIVVAGDLSTGDVAATEQPPESSSRMALSSVLNDVRLGTPSQEEGVCLTTGEI